MLLILLSVRFGATLARSQVSGGLAGPGSHCGAVVSTPVLVRLLRVRRCCVLYGFTSDLQCAVGFSAVHPKAGMHRGLLAAVLTFAGPGLKGCRGVSYNP